VPWEPTVQCWRDAGANLIVDDHATESPSMMEKRGRWVRRNEI